ncbi:hypothetical protein B0T13DRAFT_455442 [Neurospora crassa]|nr:hypothetical protein B0T13DRAFT_455442 [Neurospora crassa]
MEALSPFLCCVFVPATASIIDPYLAFCRPQSDSAGTTHTMSRKGRWKDATEQHGATYIIHSSCLAVENEGRALVILDLSRDFTKTKDRCKPANLGGSSTPRNMGIFHIPATGMLQSTEMLKEDRH